MYHIACGWQVNCGAQGSGCTISSELSVRGSLIVELPALDNSILLRWVIANWKNGRRSAGSCNHILVRKNGGKGGSLSKIHEPLKQSINIHTKLNSFINNLYIVFN